jgi:hypothetical protein
MKFPVFSLVIREFDAETGSQQTAPSAMESAMLRASRHHQAATCFGPALRLHKSCERAGAIRADQSPTDVPGAASQDALSPLRAIHRFPFAQSHQARWNLNAAMGTELFRHREKVAEFPLEPPLTEHLRPPLIGICSQNCGRIRE